MNRPRTSRSTGGSSRRARAVAAALFCCGLLLVPLCAFAAGGHKKLSPLEAGLSFYKGKTITMIAANSVGGPVDLLARALAPYVGSYLHASINIEDLPLGNTIQGQDTLAGAPQNGLTVGFLPLLNDASLALTNTPGLDFNPERMEYIASNGNAPDLLIASRSSGYTSIGQLKSSRTPVTVITENTGVLNTLLRVMLGVLGVHPNYITGYSSLAAEIQGFNRGDGPLVFLGLSSIAPQVASGTVNALAITMLPPVGTADRSALLKIPTITQLMAKYPPKSATAKGQYLALQALSTISTPMVTGTKVPGDDLAALRAAAVFAFKQPGFKATALSEGINPSYQDPVSAKASYITSLTKGKLVVCYIEGSC